MFTYEEIQSLNQLEIEVYNYVLVHMEEVLQMKIRELANAAHVSTTTVLRFCAKMGADGYSEFKYKLKDYKSQNNIVKHEEDYTLQMNFLKHIQDREFDERLQRCAQVIVDSDYVTFFGVSNSATLGKYGARCLSDIGCYAQYIDDPYYPIAYNEEKKSVFIALSVSGESPVTIDQIRAHKQQKEYIITITNSENCTAARMSDLAICYYMPLIKYNDIYNITTQVPVVVILETLSHKVHSLLAKRHQEG